MKEILEEGKSYVLAAMPGKRSNPVRIMKPEAYAYHSAEIRERNGDRARQGAVESLSRLLPDGAEGFLVDARVEGTKGGASRVSLVAMREETYLSASDNGKTRVYAIESLIPRSGDAAWLAKFGPTALRILRSRGRIVERLLVRDDFRSETIPAGEGEPRFVLDFSGGTVGAPYPKGMRKPLKALSFRPFDARIMKRRRLALFAAALMLPWFAAAATAAVRAEAYRSRFIELEKIGQEVEERALAFSESEKAIRELNAARNRNAALRRTLAACLDGFSAQGSRLLSFSYNGANFSVAGRGGKPLEIMRRLSLDRSVRDLRLLETGLEGRKAGEDNRFTIMGKFN